MNIAIMQDVYSLLKQDKTHVGLDSVMKRIESDEVASTAGESFITMAILHEIALYFYNKHNEEIIDKIGDDSAIYDDEKRDMIYKVLMASTKRFYDLGEFSIAYNFGNVPRRVEWYEDLESSEFEIAKIDFKFSPLLASGDDEDLVFQYSKYTFNEDSGFYEFDKKDEWKKGLMVSNNVKIYDPKDFVPYTKKNLQNLNKNKRK